MKTVKKTSVKKYQKGAQTGATGVGKSTTTEKGSMGTMSKKPLTPKAAYGMAVKPGMMQSGGERESFASRKIKTVSVSPDKNYKTTVKEKMGPSGVSTKVKNRRTVKGVASGAPKPRMMK